MKGNSLKKYGGHKGHCRPMGAGWGLTGCMEGQRGGRWERQGRTRLEKALWRLDVLCRQEGLIWPR